jgi:hypothetical protein
LLIGEHERAVDHLLVAHPQLEGNALVELAIDMDLIDCYLALGRIDDARAVARRGIEARDADTRPYRQRLDEITDLYGVPDESPAP